MRLIDRVAQRYGSTFWEGEASPAAVLTTTYGAPGNEAILPQIATYARDAYKGNGVVFGAILARLSLFSEATFAFQDLADKHLYGAFQSDGRSSQALSRLESPWPNGTTGELLARMIQDVDLAGNAYIWNAGPLLVRLRPDQVTIVSSEVELDGGQSYREVVGYYWDPNPMATGPSPQAQYYDVSEVAHWSPIPDPEANFKGMSWMTPIIREVTADTALTNYKLKYLQNAATPNLLIKYKQKLLPETIDSLRERMSARYGGVDNAFKTLVLDQGADTTIVGNSLEQMNFTTVQAAGENRILIASGVPGIVVGSKEGLMAATYSNYQQAMRRFADITMRPLWRSACAALASVVSVPTGSRLWYNVADIAALREGEQEQANTLLIKSSAAANLVRFGFDPASVVLAIEGNDFSLLEHTGVSIDVTTEVPKAAPAPLVLPNPSPTAQATPGQDNSQLSA